MNKNTTQVRWTAIADKMRSAIEQNELLPGDRLPSETEMAAQWQVSTMTVHRAMQELQREGLIVRKRKAGTVVAERFTEVTRRVALVFGSWGDRLISSYALGIRDTLPTDARLIPYDSRFTIRHEKACLEQIEAENATDALLVCATCAPENTPLLLHLARKHPLIFVDRVPLGFENTDVFWDAVMTDNYGSMRNGLELLHKRGHERIAYFRGDISSISSARERFEAYQQFMAEQGKKDVSLWVRELATDLPHFAYWEQVQNHLHDLLKGPEPITAVCCQQRSNDGSHLRSLRSTARGCARTTRSLEFLRFRPFGFATARSVHRLEQRSYEMGSMAARRLLLRLENPTLPSQIMRLLADLHPATTTGPRPHPQGYRNGESALLLSADSQLMASTG